MFGFSQKQKTGYWTQRTHILRADEYECSVCKVRISKPLKECPHCKAKMKKSKYDPSWVDEIEFLEDMFG